MPKEDGIGTPIFGPGELNSTINRNPIAKKFSNADPFDVLKEVVRDYYEPDLFENHGSIFYAEVLRVKTSAKGEVEVKPGGIHSVLSQRLGVPIPNDLFEVVVRIPELHSHLPYPKTLGSTEGVHQKIIDMHPTYVGHNSSMAIPKVGEVIRVNINSETVEGGLAEQPGISAGTSYTSTDVYNNGTPTRLGDTGTRGAGTFTPTTSFSIEPGSSIASVVQNGPSFNGKEKIKKQTTLFVCHETAGAGTAERSATRVNNKGGGVHFWCGRDGRILQTGRVIQNMPHANWANQISVGIEVSNIVWLKDSQVAKWERKGFVIVGPSAGSAMPGRDKLKTAHNIGGYKGAANYTLPTEIQCNKTWELIRSLSTSPPHESVRIPIKFPAAPDGKFIWGRYAGGTRRADGDYTNGVKNGNTPRWWKNNKEAHYGITSHARWTHSDGLFIEYYCLGRASLYKNDSEGAFYAAVGALLHPGVARGVTKVPNKEYETLGRTAMSGIPINSAVRGMDFSEALVYMPDIEYA